MPGCETQPTWDEIRCRRTDPSKYERFTRKSAGDGISFVLGWKDGKSEIQSVRFSKSKGWTLEKAKEWIGNHPKLKADEAMDIKKLGSNPFVYEKRVENDDGSVTYRNAVLLAEGTWRDGATGTSVFYPGEVMEKCQKNWVSDFYTLNHGNSPLDILGTVSNRRYQDKKLMGDVTFHRGTQPSRDAEWLAEQGFVDGNSVEVATQDVWDESRGVYRADFMEFQRVSLVIKPACSTCRLSACPLPEDEYLPGPNREGDDMGDCPEEKEKKLKAKAEELEKKLTEAESQTKELQEKSEKLSQEHEELKSLTEAKDKEISELKAEVEKLKNEPVHQSLAGDSGAKGDLKYHSDIVIRDGEVYREV